MILKRTNGVPLISEIRKGDRFITEAGEDIDTILGLDGGFVELKSNSVVITRPNEDGQIITQILDRDAAGMVAALIMTNYLFDGLLKEIEHDDNELCYHCGGRKKTFMQDHDTYLEEVYGCPDCDS